MAKTIMKKFLWLVIITAIFGCSKASDIQRARDLRESEEITSGESNKQLAVGKLQVKDRKIIKMGEIRFESPMLNETRKRIDTAIEKFGGYISKENAYGHEERIEQSIVIRVPAENFDKLTAEISTYAKKIDRKHIEARDVTEEYLDIELRIKIKKETENRYRMLLTQAKTVKDILVIEKQIGELRTEIESIEGRLKYLRDRVSYSTLTVTFYQKISTPVGFSSKFKEGLKNGWNGFVWFLVGLVNIWPFLLVLLGISGFIIYRSKRKVKKVDPEDTAKDKT